mgnify:CR=1 FL=1
MNIKKVVTCGSVDDGKSTLIGRIIFETQNILDDQKSKLKKLSLRFGTTGSKLDYALLLDGLQDEREQGITIDVAHRYINYKNQRIVFHDSPGHYQYNSNVITAASNCDIAILLIDVKKGILNQTKRHLKILEFLNLKNIIFAFNKIDLVKYDKKIFFKLKEDLKKTLHSNVKSSFVPISALNGDNVVFKSKKMRWYKGRSILDTINSITLKRNRITKPYLTVQHIHRPNRLTRNYLGDLRGSLKVNQKIKILPGGHIANIKNIYSNFKKLKKVSNSPISLNFKKQFDISKGDIILGLNNQQISTGDAFNAEIVITSDEKIISGRQYFLRIHDKFSKVTITKIKSVFNFRNNLNVKTNLLNPNDIGQIEFCSNDIIPFSTFNQLADIGRFILIDEVNFKIVGAGKINFALRRSRNIFKTVSKINQKNRADLKYQKAKCIWLTGLSGSGKSTIAQHLEKELFVKSKHTYILDGDNLRLGVNKNLGFTAADRAENVRRIAEIAKIMVDAGLIVIVAVISPFRKDRHFAKSLFQKKEFYEVYVNTPLKVCMKRDPKKLYTKVKNIKGFNKIGLTGSYEKPENPFIKIDTSKETIINSVKKIIKGVFN